MIYIYIITLVLYVVYIFNPLPDLQAANLRQLAHFRFALRTIEPPETVTPGEGHQRHDESPAMQLGIIEKTMRKAGLSVFFAIRGVIDPKILPLRPTYVS